MFLKDALKESKSSTTKIRKLEKSIAVEEENLKIMEVGEDPDTDMVIVSKKKRQKMKGPGPLIKRLTVFL